MVPSRLRETALWTWLGKSDSIRRYLHRLDALIHYNSFATRFRGRSHSEEHIDSCSLHSKRVAPPTSYTGVPSPLSSPPTDGGFVNPILTAEDITDYGTVDYVADPFLLLTPDDWQIYFEIYNHDRSPTGVIGRATSVDHGRSWQYDRVVLNPGVHTSFPYVFRWDDKVWMTPNLDPPDAVGDVPLYRSDDGGASFVKHVTLARPIDTPTDRVVFRWGGRWWLFLSVTGTTRELHLYHSEELTAPDWTPHEQNPVVVDEPRIPGGRPVVLDDRIIVFVQNGPHYYGEEVEALEITDLSPTTYEDRRVSSGPVVGPAGSMVGWNSARMHTFDPWFTDDRWVCAVDGDTDLGSSLIGPHWSIGLCSIARDG